MGHVINHFSFEVDKYSKEQIATEIQDHVHRERSSLDSAIRWFDPICDDEKAAKEYLEAHDKGWYDNLAVRYRTIALGITSAKRDSLAEQRRELSNKIRELESRVYAKEFKAQLTTCKHCGSKLNKDYLKSNFCPLCHADMRSQTILDNLQKLKDKRDALDQKIRDEESKLAKKHGIVCWLVKFEYHV